MRPSKERSRINASLVPQERKFWRDVPERIGIYADDALTLINQNPSIQGAWLNDCTRWGVTDITLYNMSDVCVAANFGKIKNFIALAVTKGIKKVGGVWGSINTVTKMQTYQNQADAQNALVKFLEE